MKRRSLIATAFVIVAAATMPVSADELPPNCNTADGSATAPHLVDPANDWDGLVTGNESSAVPNGDVNREGADLLRGWLNFDASRPSAQRWQANIIVQELTGREVNAYFYFQWVHDANDPVAGTKYVSGNVSRTVGAATSPTVPLWQFRYGHFDRTQTPASYVSDGTTTGTFTLGPLGLITIDVPMNRLGNPQPGHVLDDFRVEAKLLLGVPLTGGFFLGNADVMAGLPCEVVLVV